MKCNSSPESSKRVPDAVYVAPGVKTCVSDLIRQRAYELFEERGHQPGRDIEDWLQAEREVKSNTGNRDGEIR
jgi:hypothetical protein